jgi:hypothetical protein
MNKKLNLPEIPVPIKVPEFIPIPAEPVNPGFPEIDPESFPVQPPAPKEMPPIHFPDSI